MDVNRIIQIALASAGIINCLSVSLFLLFYARIGNPKTNKILALLLLAIAIKLSYGILINYRHKWGLPSYMIFNAAKAAFFTFGPLLLLYFRTLLKKRTSKLIVTLIFLPAFSPFIGLLFRYYMPLWIMQLYFLIFLVITWFELRALYSDNNKYRYLDTEKSRLMIFYASFAFLWIIVNLLFINRRLYFFELLVIFTLVFYMNIFIFIKHYYIKQGDLSKLVKYKNINLSAEEEDEILLKLQSVMEDAKLYIDSEITLPKVAEKINVRTYKLSHVINQRTNMTFNEYINTFRIKDIKKALKLKDYKEDKIANIAFDYGFNSLSVFNTAFKKFTGYTPSQFRNEDVSFN